MIIRVPFAYTASVVAPRKRNPETKHFDEWIEVEIREASDAEAPVALRWYDEVPAELRSWIEADKWGAFPEDGICETRWLDNSHWEPVLEADGRSGGKPRMNAATLARRCEERRDHHNPLMLNYVRTGNGPLAPEDYRSVNDSTRESQIAAIKAKAAELLVVDGMIWRRTAEPVCYLKAWADFGHSYQSAIKMLPADSPAIKDRRSIYRADRFDEAAEAAILRNRPVEVDSMNLHRRVEVLIPESLSYRDEEQALLHVAERLLEKMGSKELRQVSAEEASAWFALQAAWGMSESLSEGCEAIAQALEPFSTVADSDMRAEAERALSRWHSRPITVEEELSLDMGGGPCP